MEQQQRRIYSLAIGVVAIVTIGMTLLPWVDLSILGVPATWNGLGKTGDPAVAAADLGPHAYGWWVVVAGVIAGIAALLLLLEGAAERSIAAAGLWFAAACALAATAVPTITLISPSWLIGDFMHQIGAGELIGVAGRDFLNIPVVAAVIVALTLLAVLCAGTARAVRRCARPEQS